MECIWAAIGAFAAVAAVLVSIWVALRRQRRPVVVLLATKTRVGPDSTSDRLGMTWDGVPIADPWLVTLTVLNESRDDIASDKFDNKRPLVLSLGTAEVKETLSAPFNGQPWNLPADRSRGAVEFRPYLIRAGVPVEIQLVVAGEPDFDWGDPPLTNANISHSVTASRASRSDVYFATSVTFAASSGMLVAVGLVLAAGGDRESGIYFALAALISLVGAAAAASAGFAALMVSSRSH